MTARFWIAAGLAAGALVTAACGSSSSGQTTATSKADVTLGAQLFAQHCAVCHGATGEGAAGPKLAGGRTKKQFPDARTEVLFVSMGSGIMPPFAKTLTAEQIRAVVEYTRSL